jgi:hypothetical protein
MEDGIGLDQVAARTKIAARLLTAIEEDDFERLPGGVFRRSFARQYALALGFSEVEIAADLDRIAADGPAPEEVAAPAALSMPRRAAARISEVHVFEIRPDSPLSRALQPFGAFLVVVAVAALCAGVYGWSKSPPPAANPPVQAPSANPVEAPPPAAPAIEVAFHATEPTWVSVTSDGRQSFSSALQGGAERTVAATEMVRVLVGNAGGLELSLNGKPVGPLGPRGQVRIVELTSAGAQIQTAPRKSAPAAEPL